MDKVLLESFAQRAEQKRQSRMEIKEFEFPGVGKLKFQKLSQRDQIEFIGRMMENTEKYAVLLDLQNELICDCCPALQDADLQQALGVIDPYDTVRTLLDVVETQELATRLIDWMGLTNKTDEKENPVKN